jgi:hypothetical protein
MAMSRSMLEMSHADKYNHWRDAMPKRYTPTGKAGVWT